MGKSCEHARIIRNERAAKVLLASLCVMLASSEALAHDAKLSMSLPAESVTITFTSFSPSRAASLPETSIYLMALVNGATESGHDLYHKAEKWRDGTPRKLYADSQFQLGKSFYFGVLAPQNLAMAYLFLSFAENNGARGAAALRSQLADEMTPEQLSRAQLMLFDLMDRF